MQLLGVLLQNYSYSVSDFLWTFLLLYSYIRFCLKDPNKWDCLLGVLRWERRAALRASKLNWGTGVLTGPGRTPAFHWVMLSRFMAVSVGIGWSWAGDAHKGRVWVRGSVGRRLAGTGGEESWALRNIWQNRGTKTEDCCWCEFTRSSIYSHDTWWWLHHAMGMFFLVDGTQQIP